MRGEVLGQATGEEVVGHAELVARTREARMTQQMLGVHMTMRATSSQTSWTKRTQYAR